MTLSFQDFSAQSHKTGDELLRDLTLALAGMQATRRATKTGYANWRAKTNAPKTQNGAQATPSGMIFEHLMMSMLFQSLFGLPLFSGLGIDAGMAQGLGLVGSGLHHDMANSKNKSLDEAATINIALLDAQRTRMNDALSAQAARAQDLSSMKQAVMALMLWMLAQEEQGGDSGEADVVPDALRHPKLARFKQNRHSMECVRSLFKSQAAMTTPDFMAYRAA